jgi:phosphatidylglycerophosphate synthase
MLAFTADLLTFSRLIAAAILIWLGIRGSGTLTQAVAVGALAWTTDQLDGWAARRATTPTHLASVDFIIDVVLYAGTLAYFVLAGFLSLALVLGFAALAVTVCLLFRRKAVAVLCVRVIDLASVIVIFEHRPLIGVLLVGWLAALGLIYRRRVAERLPRWLEELKALIGPKGA